MLLNGRIVEYGSGMVRLGLCDGGYTILNGNFHGRMVIKPLDLGAGLLPVPFVASAEGFPLATPIP